MNHKARYFIPGSLFPEETVVTLTARSVEEATTKAPPSAFCFELFDTEQTPDLGPDFKVSPVAKNKSGRYYLGGHLYDRAEVEALGHDILASNMRANRWDRVIQCCTGNWQPFEDADEIVSPS